MRQRIALIICSVLFLAGFFSGCINNGEDDQNNNDDEIIYEGNVWIMNIEGDKQNQITSDGAGYNNPNYDPKGQTILFSRGNEIWIMDTDGKNKVNLTSNENILHPYYTHNQNELIGILDWNKIINYNISNASYDLIFDYEGEGELWYPSYSPNNLKIIYQNHVGIGDAKNTNQICIYNIPDEENYIVVDNANSPSFLDDNWILFSENYSICKFNLQTKEKISLTDNKINSFPKANKDGTKIVYCSQSDGGKNIDIWIMDSDGSNKIKLTNDSDYNYNSPNFSPDGNKIIYER